MAAMLASFSIKTGARNSFASSFPFQLSAKLPGDGSLKLDGKAGPLDPAPFVYPVANFYMTDPITRASATIAKCAEAFLLPKARTGTHG